MGWIGSVGKTGPRILIFSIAMDANNSFNVKFMVTYASTFFWYNISFLAMVSRHFCARLFMGI
jgi:hypothetical protein